MRILVALCLMIGVNTATYATAEEPAKARQAPAQQTEIKPDLDQSSDLSSHAASIAPIGGDGVVVDWAALFTVVFSGLVATFTGLLWYSTRGLWTATKANADAAADSASAAKRLIETTLAVEAPYLLPELVEPPVIPDAGRARVTYTFANEGKSVAILLKFQDILRFLPPPLPEDPDTLFGDRWADRKLKYSPFGPGRAARGIEQHFVCRLAPQDAERLATEGKFFLVGRVEYADLFGRRREQRFCWSIDRNGRAIQRAGGVNYNFDRSIEIEQGG